MSAEEVRRRSFSSAFRGFDQAEVRGFLDRIADELEAYDRTEKELRAELREARDRVLHPRLDEDTLTSALGQEAAQILRSAHEAGGDVRRRAEEHAARVLGEAHKEAERIRAVAETVMGERTIEAEAAADSIRAAAEAEVAAVLGRARQQAAAALEEARTRCDELSQESEALKGQVLGELARRRRIMHAQVEQLGAGRETILVALQEVRRMLDQTVDSLDRVAIEAKTAAEEARVRALTDPELEGSDLEREAGAALSSPLDGLTKVMAGLEQSLAALAAGEPVALEAAPSAATAGEARSSEAAATAGPSGGVATGELEAGQPLAGPVEPAAAEVATEDVATAEGADAASVPGAQGPPEPEDDDEESYTEMERRGALRLLRRGRPRPVTEAPASYAPEPGEGVRVIRSAAPPPSADEEEEAAEAIGAISAAEISAPVSADAGLQEDEQHASVDDLFARLRAERAAAREHAEAVLAESPGDVTEPEGETPAPEVAAVGAVGETAPADDEAEAAAVSGGDEPESEPDDEAAEAPLLDMRNRMLGSVHERLARRLKRTLQDDQNEMLDRVRAAGRGGAGPLLPEETEHRGSYATAVGPLMEEAFRAGTLFAAEVFPGASPQPDGRNGAVADALATELVVQLRARLTALFEAPDGGEAEDLAEGASAAYRAWKGERVESLAMDYVVDSFTAGVLAAVPGGTRLRWVVDDDTPCPDCDDNALAGPTTAGESFPTGQQHPPAHPGCRCLLAPALT
ncbi:MAG TPA: DivIVA domain-containing protein [Acidimicrobiales bacterium]|nr:DivIVA domain-containing protein [Acidimicrobiales bacterium]